MTMAMDRAPDPAHFEAQHRLQQHTRGQLWRPPHAPAHGAALPTSLGRCAAPPAALTAPAPRGWTVVPAAMAPDAAGAAGLGLAAQHRARLTHVVLRNFHLGLHNPALRAAAGLFANMARDEYGHPYHPIEPLEVRAGQLSSGVMHPHTSALTKHLSFDLMMLT